MRSIALGTQEVGEAFRNLGVAILTSLTDAIIQLTIIEPLITNLKKALDAGSGAGGGFDFGDFFGSLIGGLFGGSADNGLVVPGPIGRPRLIKAHGGETILPTHKSMAGMMASGWQGGGSQTKVEINGDIIPRGPWATPQDVVRITSKSIKDQTDVFVAIKNYGPGR
jgi:hypothetical protein